jgi:hypothetical protein
MHGCCSGNKTSWEAQGTTAGQRFDAGGEKWHYSNAWFASRGYVVITYTARGFVDRSNHGSTGETQLDSRSFEINDFQHLACQVTSLFNSSGGLPDIDPSRVVPTGGSYGGGFSWMAATDPQWDCTADTGTSVSMGLAAAAPKYGWTDLVNSLVPTGTHSGQPGDLPDFSGCDSGPYHPDATDCPAPATPIGLPKRSINAGLYATGKTGTPPDFNHTTFPPSIDSTFACTQGPDLGSQSPLCPGIRETLAEFLRERSAYYQQDFFDHVQNGDPGYEVPIFDAATLTDWLFPVIENRRMINRLRSIDPGYPLQAYYGDYQHFTQNKAKVWGDVCDSGGTRHVCNNADFAGNFNADPASLQRLGVTTRLNRFIDHYATPPANSSQPAPSFDVTAELEVCPQNSESLDVPADEGGPQFAAPTFEQIAPNTLTVNASGAQTTTNDAEPNPHAANSDPVQNDLANDGKCPVETGPAGPGVASYTSEPLPSDFTMVGGTALTVDFEATGPVGQMNSRLYDIFPDGSAVMVDRGPRRLLASEVSGGQATYELYGNGWRFPAGHSVRIELAQDDEPFLHLTEMPSSAALSAAVLRIPIREASATVSAKPTLEKGACANKTVGTILGDKLIGSPQGDRIDGGNGNDTINGRGGRDCLNGQAGNDRVFGGKGRDKLNGGGGKDRLSGGRGKDRLRGGRGRDLIKARDGKRDRVKCGKGRDRAKVDRRDRVRGCERVRRR